VTVDERDSLADRFEEHRTRLRAVAYRILGSLSEADDAVQEAWIRLSRSDANRIENLGAWLTTVTARTSLTILRTRTSRREEPLGVRMPDPVVDGVDERDPEHEALVTDAVGLALMVVCERLSPAERVAFVLHDMFAVSFDEIAPVVERSPDATRQLASRARRRVRAEETVPDANPDAQREVVDAFLAAARDGDLNRLVTVLDPDVVLRVDRGPKHRLLEVHGAEAVGRRAATFAQIGLVPQLALINGVAGVVATRDGRPFAVQAFTVRNGKVVAMDILADRERLAQLDLTRLA
jgi:RNA polymerase sigma-70 factor (ECF subfamily)